MKTDAIKKKKALLEALEEVFHAIEVAEKELQQDYRQTDKLEQKTTYDRDLHDFVPVYDDNGDPVMINVWEYVNIPEEEMTEEKHLKLCAFRDIEKALEKLL